MEGEQTLDCLYGYCIGMFLLLVQDVQARVLLLCDSPSMVISGNEGGGASVVVTEAITQTSHV